MNLGIILIGIGFAMIAILSVFFFSSIIIRKKFPKLECILILVGVALMFIGSWVCKGTNSISENSISADSVSSNEGLEINTTIEVSAKYDPETIEVFMGLEEPKDVPMVEFDGITAKRIDGENEWYDVTFYIFESDLDANLAFNYIKENNLNLTEITDSYIIGQVKDLEDIRMDMWYYVTSNMIIERMDYISDPGTTTPPSDTMTENNIARHTEIMNML